MTHAALEALQIGATVATKVQMDPEPPPTIQQQRWQGKGASWSQSGTKDAHATHSSSLINADEGKLLSSSYHQ